MWNYSPTALDHYLDPQFCGLPKHSTVIGEAIDPVSDSIYRVGVKLSYRGVIEQAGFEWSGSAISVASTSFLLQLVQNRSIELAARTTPEELARLMDGLPEDELRLQPLGLQALRDALGQWQVTQQGREARFICTCNAVPLSRIHQVIAEGASTIGALGRLTGAGTGCGSCVDELMRILRETEDLRQRKARSESLTPNLSPAELARLEAIEAVLDAEVRPGLQLDGGGLEVIGLRDKTVTVRLWGACRGCASKPSTMRYLIEDRLHGLVDPGLVVVEG